MKIKLTDLKAKPCQDYLDLFVDGEIDVYEAFEKLGEQWGWLFNNIIDRNIIISQFDAEKYDWVNWSHYVARFCPQYFYAEKYNWVNWSHYVAEFCPQFSHLDPRKK